MLSGMVRISLYRLAAETSASPTPVLPEVGSTITDSPGRSRPSRSAASIIDSAIRSFSEPPGLNCSHLQNTSAIEGSTR